MCGGRCGSSVRALSAAATALGLASSSSFITSNGAPFIAASCSGILPPCTPLALQQYTHKNTLAYVQYAHADVHVRWHDQ